MKPILLTLAILFHLAGQSQPKTFEGIIHYKVVHTSKLAAVSATDFARENPGNTMTIYIKNGKKKIVAGDFTTYSLPGEENSYRIISGFDTLYTIEPDTTKQQKIEQKAQRSTIAGYDCESASFKERIYTYDYCFARDIVCDKNSNDPDIWLSQKVSCIFSEQAITCTQVEPRPLDDSIFALPAFPRTKYQYNMHYTKAELPGGWGKYLQRTLNADLALKYVKIPKGAEGASATARVVFVVTPAGNIADVMVENPKEIHPKLAAEAVRVVTESNRWKPVTYRGKKVPQVLVQPISFAITK